MSAHAFIASLQARGATLEATAGRLRVTPANVLTDADRAIWRQHREAILQVLAPSSTCSDFDVGAAYDPDEARAYTDELHRDGEITDRHRDQLHRYADAPSRTRDGPTAASTCSLQGVC